MGVVRRQGIKQSAVTYAAMLVGAASLLFLYPLAFSAEQIGILNFVRDAAVLVAPFLFWGGAELIVRYFPVFKNHHKGHQGFLFLLHLIFAAGVATLLVLYFVFKGSVLEFYSQKSPLFPEFLPFILPTAVLLTYAAIFSSHASNFQRTAVPAVFSELLPKVGAALLAAAFYWQALSFQGIFYGQVLLLGLVLLAQIWYVWRLGELHLRPDFSFLKKPLVRDLASFGLYGLVGSLGSRLAERINVVMLASLSTLSAAGIFTVAYFISDAVDVPRRAISRIASPLLADKWKEGKMADIQEIYQKSSLNQLIAGMALLLAAWVSVDDLFRLMPNGAVFSQGKHVILLIGLARLVDMATGVNSEILSYSKHFRINFYLILCLAAFNVAANLLLIPLLHINGAALATLVSITLYNLLKFIFIKWKIDLQPFTRRTAWVLLMGLAAWLATLPLPDLRSPLLAIALKSSTALAVFGGLVLWFKVSPDISHLAAAAAARLSKAGR